MKTTNKIKKYLKEIGLGISAILLVIAIIGAWIYSKLVTQSFVVALIAMLLAVFGSYYLFLSFEREEKPLELEKGEKRNLKTVDVGVVIFPKKLGGIRSKEMNRNLSIYLTNKRIIARNSWNEYFLDLPLSSIQGMELVKVIATEYIRIRFLEKGKQKDALLFVGDKNGTMLWLERLEKLGVKELAKKEQEEESFLGDVDEVKEKI